MVNVKSKLKRGALVAGAALLMSACANNKAAKEDTNQDAQPTKIENVTKARKDSLIRERNVAEYQVDALKDSVRIKKDMAEKLYCQARNEYWSRLDKKYTMAKFCSADEMKYFSSLANKILQNPDAFEAETGLESVLYNYWGENAGDVIDVMGRYGAATLDNVKRVADGNGTLVDLQAMVNRTTFGAILNKAEMKELGKYVDFPGAYEHSGNTIAYYKNWGDILKEYLAANVSLNNSDGVAAGPNYRIPEMQKIQKKYDNLMSEIKTLEQKEWDMHGAIGDINMQLAGRDR